MKIIYTVHISPTPLRGKRSVPRTVLCLCVMMCLESH